MESKTGLEKKCAGSTMDLFSYFDAKVYKSNANVFKSNANTSVFFKSNANAS